MPGPRSCGPLAVLFLAVLLRAKGSLCSAAASGELQSPHLNCRINNDSIQVSCTPDFQDLPVTYHWELKKTFLSDQPVVSIEGSLNHSEQITCTIITANSNASTSIRLQECYPPGPPAYTRNRRITRVLFIILITMMIVVIWFLLYRKLAVAAER